MNTLTITIKQLEAFIAVAETGGFRRAAERLNLSQSAVTTHVKMLEGQLGASLFHRTTRSVRLTDAGQKLHVQAGRTLVSLAETVRRFHDESALQRGRVTLSIAPSFAASLLPEILVEFHRRHPNIVIDMVEAYADDILEAVRTHAADFGVGPIDRQPGEFIFNHLLTDNMTAIVARDHQLSGRSTICIDELARQTLLVMPRLSETRRRLETAFAARELTLEPAYEMLHHQTLIAMAEAGVGVGVLPGIALRGAGRGQCSLLTVKNPQITRHIGTIRLRDQSLSPAAAALSTAISDALKAEAPVTELNAAHGSVNL